MKTAFLCFINDVLKICEEEGLFFLKKADFFLKDAFNV